MAPLPVIGNCVRVAFNWSTVSGVRPVNVIHLITSSENESAIGEALDEAFDAMTTNCWSPLASVYGLESYTITLLNGTSASQVVDAATGITGSTGGQIMPAVAAVLSLRSNQRGARGRGRMYLGPMGEAGQNGGLVEAENRTAALTGWQEVADSLEANELNISIGVASYIHEEVNGLTNFAMRSQVGTQRRRQDQLV